MKWTVSEPKPPEYVIGLDLGQSQEFTALAVVEKTWRFEKSLGRQIAIYAVRHLERFQLGTQYSIIVEVLRELTAKAPLRGGTLVVDRTNVGRPVVELFRSARFAAKLMPIAITNGQGVRAHSGLCVPKQDLVGVLQVLLQNGWLKVSGKLADTATLIDEFQHFKIKPASVQNESFESWRERPHDDMVLAVAIACWAANRMPAPGRSGPFHRPFNNPFPLG